MSEIAFIKCIGYNTVYGSLQGNDVTETGAKTV